ncbi:peroxiredoxin [Sorangium sp. So ce1036]|uniref:peroxiredoxin n=1 Tax=Sorangium sp. So ce1036 TaxID=3133328 RepID=UPI003F08B41C
MSIARVGELAPVFTMPVFDPAAPNNFDLSVSLSDYSGRWLLFFYYPMDFTFVCPTELLALADRRAEFDQLGASLLGCSTDTIHTHRAWAMTPREHNGISGVNYPIGADHSGEVARAYGVLIEGVHVALRGLFIIDPKGILQYAVIHSLNIGRSTDETLRVLAALQTGGLCPSDWKPGKETIHAGAGPRRAA